MDNKEYFALFLPPPPCQKVIYSWVDLVLWLLPPDLVREQPSRSVAGHKILRHLSLSIAKWVWWPLFCLQQTLVHISNLSGLAGLLNWSGKIQRETAGVAGALTACIANAQALPAHLMPGSTWRVTVLNLLSAHNSLKRNHSRRLFTSSRVAYVTKSERNGFALLSIPLSAPLEMGYCVCWFPPLPL